MIKKSNDQLITANYELNTGLCWIIVLSKLALSSFSVNGPAIFPSTRSGEARECKLKIHLISVLLGLSWSSFWHSRFLFKFSASAFTRTFYESRFYASDAVILILFLRHFSESSFAWLDFWSSFNYFILTRKITLNLNCVVYYNILCWFLRISLLQAYSENVSVSYFFTTMSYLSVWYKGHDVQ